MADSTINDCIGWLKTARSELRGELSKAGAGSAVASQAFQTIEVVISHLETVAAQPVPASAAREGHMTDMVDATTFARRAALELAIKSFGKEAVKMALGSELVHRAEEFLAFIEAP